MLPSKEGKRLFIAQIQEKLSTEHRNRGGLTTYNRLMAQEVASFQRMVVHGEPYEPYRYG